MDIKAVCYCRVAVSRTYTGSATQKLLAAHASLVFEVSCWAQPCPGKNGCMSVQQQGYTIRFAVLTVTRSVIARFVAHPSPLLHRAGKHTLPLQGAGLRIQST